MSDVDDIFEGHDDDFEHGEVEFMPDYVGKWPAAILLEANPLPKTPFGYEIQLVLNLKGEEGKLRYTGRVRLPRTVTSDGLDQGQFERAQKGNEFTKNGFNTIAGAAGILPKGQRFGNVDSEDKYDRIVSAFRMKIGATVPVHIKPQQKKVTQADGSVKWVNDERGFTTLAGLQAAKS